MNRARVIVLFAAIMGFSALAVPAAHAGKRKPASALESIPRVEVNSDRTQVLAAPRPGAPIIAFVFKGDILPKVAASRDGKFVGIRYAAAADGWIDAVAARSTKKPLMGGLEEEGGAFTPTTLVDDTPGPKSAPPPPARDEDEDKGKAKAKDEDEMRFEPEPAAPAAPKRSSRDDDDGDDGDATAAIDSEEPGSGFADAPVEDPGAGAAEPSASTSLATAVRSRHSRVTLDARAGYAMLSEHYVSDATGPNDSYKARLAHAVLDLVLHVRVNRYFILDGAYALGYAPAITLAWPDGSDLRIGLASHRLDLGAAYRIPLYKPLLLAVSARAGLAATRFEMVAANPDSYILSTTYVAVAAGVRVEAARLVKNLGAIVSADLLVPFVVSQGPYASGSEKSAIGARATAALSYSVTPSVSLSAGWGLTYVRTKFSGAGSRHGDTNAWARNADTLNTFELGARFAF